MTDRNRNLSPDDLEALLPWHAAGTLDKGQAKEVENALARDGELARRFALVREEMTETILLNEALGVPSARVTDKLFKAIDKERKSARVTASAASGGLGAWLADLFTPRVLAFSASAAAVVILLQAGVIAKIMLTEQGGGETYETSSVPVATRGIELASYALVRFAPQATISDITRFLDGRGAVIVDGPRPGGVGGMYRIRIANSRLPKDDLDRAVKEFQASSNLVSFAAPTE
jgi:anti-sigma factor RsiW